MFQSRNQDYGCRDPSHWPRGTLYLQKVGTNFADRQSFGQCSSLADSFLDAEFTTLTPLLLVIYYLFANFWFKNVFHAYFGIIL
jgi:hypothetical protein